MATRASRPDVEVRHALGARAQRSEDSGARPRIDIKQRLGKRTVVPSVAAIPPPVGFAPRLSPPRARERKPVRDLTVTIDASTVEAGQRRRRAVATATIAASVAALVIGYTIGNVTTRASRWNTAVVGAHELAAELSASGDRAASLSELVSRLGRTVPQGTVSKQDVGRLNETSVTLEARHLTQRGVGSLNAGLQTRLIDYVALTHKAEFERTQIVSLLGHEGRQLLASAAAEREAPRVHWAVQLADGPHGPFARVVPLQHPFPERDSWPEQILSRASSSNAPASRPRLLQLGRLDAERGGMVPVTSASLGPLRAQQFASIVQRKLRQLHTTLHGDGTEHLGVVRLGAELVTALEAVGSRR